MAIWQGRCRRQLARLAETLREGGNISVSQTQSFKPGKPSWIREWKGKVHEVVIAGGTVIYGPAITIARSPIAAPSREPGGRPPVLWPRSRAGTADG